MTPPPNDPYGSTEKTTAYEGQSKPGSKAGYSKSAWALGVAIAFLLFIVGWSMSQPGGPDPAPAGSAANGIVRTPAPTGVKE